MALDATFALEYIASRAGWDGEPELTGEEQDAILVAAQAIDSEGRTPDADDYVETYTYDSLNAAILQAWVMKLGKATEYHEGVNRGGETVIFDHCEKMVAYWSGIVSGTVIGGPIAVSGGSQSVANKAVW
jgi:hypothetical protein